MIRHTVVFKLKHAAGSGAEFDFLHAAQKLATDIAVVKNFEALRQTSLKNNYDFGLSMEFASEEDYQTYNEIRYTCSSSKPVGSPRSPTL